MKRIYFRAPEMSAMTINLQISIEIIYKKFMIANGNSSGAERRPALTKT